MMGHYYAIAERRYGLRDDQWNRIKDLLPGREGHVGVTARDKKTAGCRARAAHCRPQCGQPKRAAVGLMPSRQARRSLIFQRVGE